MPPQESSQGVAAAEERQWPQWVEWLLDERVTWADRLAERLKRSALDAWEDRQLAAFWAANPQQQRQQRLRVEVGTVHDSHGSIPDHCAAALHLPKVGLPKAHMAHAPALRAPRLPSHDETPSADRWRALPWLPPLIVMTQADARGLLQVFMGP